MKLTDKKLFLYMTLHTFKRYKKQSSYKRFNILYERTEKFAKWSHIIQFYEIDKIRLDVGEQMTPKLTDHHIYLDKLKKMKVSVAAQVFSQRVGSIMLMLSEWSG